MNGVIAICIIAIAVLGGLLCNKHTESKELKGTNMELLRRIPIMNDGAGELEPLTVERIANALRFEGFYPEVHEDKFLTFKAQGDSYYIDASRLPLVFLNKVYDLNPDNWEMDLIREAAHRMSDQLVMVKAVISEEDRSLRFFVASCDRNYESFRANIPSYLDIIEDGQRVMDREYNKMVDEKRESALRANPVLPALPQEPKILS